MTDIKDEVYIRRLLRALDQNDIPEHMHGGIFRYLTNGVSPGGFLTAVICNNLHDAVRKADDVNIDLLPAYVNFFHNNAPVACWRSRSAFDGWMKKGGLVGLEKTEGEK